MTQILSVYYQNVGFQTMGMAKEKAPNATIKYGNETLMLFMLVQVFLLRWVALRILLYTKMSQYFYKIMTP